MKNANQWAETAEEADVGQSFVFPKSERSQFD